ncbi:hypothetical protein ACGFI3_30015 [Nonomuraea wenchangensis]
MRSTSLGGDGVVLDVPVGGYSIELGRDTLARLIEYDADPFEIDAYDLA